MHKKGRARRKKISGFIRDHKVASYFSERMRLKRFALFSALIKTLPHPVHILDVGGTQSFWEDMGLCDSDKVHVTLINILNIPVTRPNFVSLLGDARSMGQFSDNQFEVVFSNSVIEHVGGYNDQKRMADEVRRVGKRYFVQTPNRYFPIDPHYVFPCFHFFPFAVRIRVLKHYYKLDDKRAQEQAIRSMKGIKLLSLRELKSLFPEAKVYCERLWLFTKSFVAYYGW